MYTIIVLDYKQSINQARQVKIKDLKTTKIPLFCNPAPKQSQPSEFRGQQSQDASNTTVQTQDTIVNEGNIKSQLSERCRPCASSPVTTSIEMFYPENNESKTVVVAKNLRGMSLTSSQNRRKQRSDLWCYGQVDQPSKIQKSFYCSIALRIIFCTHGHLNQPSSPLRILK